MQSLSLNYDNFLANAKHNCLLENHDYHYIWLWGGRGSAKTSDAVRLLTIDCLTQSYMRCIVIIKDAVKLSDSIYQQFKDFIINNGLAQWFDFKDSRYRIECVNGNIFTFRNGKDASNAKGLANYNFALFEEVDQIAKDDYDFIVGTIRNVSGSKVRIYHTFNPESGKFSYKEHWIYKNHFDVSREIYCTFEKSMQSEVRGKLETLNYIFIHSTCDDNPYCPPANIVLYDSFKDTNTAKYRIWRLGRWSNKDTENLFAYNFDIDKHVGKVKFIPDLPLHIVFDQNYKPYSTCTISVSYTHLTLPTICSV